ncbi:SRPBCC family protein [Mycolicibacterium aubagnense]|uniref:Polyketide cyclase n=1 Tax=Mycolicibacterium aubagnense TaxID=319707 RepID=A0ABM7IFC4_9MYCO|nr:SRPBCC family protein [Mycolicibacterium aubagnense]TLH56971.1 polyketide cyclase [Mycolicibacterium aubagnense]WGI32875.1 SRPBCC family protein [Mycolicibacterium aubagnense]BBX85456.1 polyketide cyclase [Mycolicibacterium aubagnense]
MTDLTFSDSIVVDTDPETLYALVSDVTNMGRWSPQCKECWWEDEDAGPVAGAWFKGRNEAGDRIWETRSQVVVAEPGREFVWEVNGGWVRWGFTLDPVEDGTRLTQSWEFLPAGIAGFHERWSDAADEQIALRERNAKEGIPVTLAAIKKTAEA